VEKMPLKLRDAKKDETQNKTKGNESTRFTRAMCGKRFEYQWMLFGKGTLLQCMNMFQQCSVKEFFVLTQLRR
jgi:hypothetical protein